MASAAPGSATAATTSTAADAPSEPCGCTNIAIMQLFHELKQQFPAVPDRVVSECISQNFHDKEACEAILRRENQGYLLHSYPSCLKMSSEADGTARPRASTVCPSVASAKTPSEGPSCTAVSVPGQPALSHVYFVNQSAASSSSSSSVFSQASKAREWVEFSDAQSSSVKRTESRWSSTHLSNSSESIASEVIKSTGCVGGDVTAPRPGVTSSSHTIVSQKEAASICRVGAEPANTSSPPGCARPTTLNVSGGVSGPTHTVSSPAIGATHFNPFQSAQQNPPHPASAGDRPPSEGDAGVPYTGSFRQRAHVFESSRGRGDPHLSPSRENITTSVYSDHTVVNSYQVNVNCSVRGGGSSSVNVSGTSSRTVVTTPEATVTTVSPPRPAPPPRPPPPHPKPKPRQRSALMVDPAPHYAQQGAWGGGAGGGTVVAPPPQQPRSYTSVNLTLRPPSSEPQAPIDIQSAGSSLMYSTSSYDPRQGYQSKLQICIGPGGVGSVSAMRTRALEAPAWGAAPIPSAVTTPVPSTGPTTAVATPARAAPPPLPSRPPAVGTLLSTSQPAPPPTSTESTLDSMASSTHSDDIHRELQALRIENLQGPTRALLERQLERKTRLQLELRREKEKLRAMQRDVRGMEKDLAQRQLAKRTSAYDALPHLSTLQKVQRLRQEIHLLTEECKKMTVEVDMNSDSRVPLGETDEEFYKNIYTGQQGSITAHALRNVQYNRGDSSQQSARLPPPRPPPPEIDRESWTCSQCTFRNYWELEYCEQCEMPKLMLGTGPRPAPGAFCYCHPNPGKQLTPSVAAYPVYVPSPKLN